MDIISTVASLLGTLSIWEVVKYFLNRKTNKRMEEAEADSKEFATLRDMIEFLQGQLKEKEERFADQTERLRHTQDENFRLLEEKAMLEIRMATGSAVDGTGGNAGMHGKESSAALRGRKKQQDGGEDEAGIQDIEGVFGKGGTAGKGKAKSAGGNTGGTRKKKEKKEDKKGGQA